MRKQEFPKKEHPKSEDLPCWKEILESALMGGFPTDQRLEQMLDHLERKA